MTLARLLLFSALAIAPLGAIAGCGGSSSSSGTSSASIQAPPAAEAKAPGGPAHATLVKEGDAICRTTDEVTATPQGEFKEVTRPGGADYESKLAGLLVRIVIIGHTEEEELAALKPPAQDRATFEHWLAVGQEGLSEFEAAAVALRSGKDSAKFNRLYEEGQSKLTQANEIASDLGFGVCGGQRI